MKRTVDKKILEDSIKNLNEKNKSFNEEYPLPDGDMNIKDYCLRPESLIEKDSITIFGAGIFGNEKLKLNRAEATLLYVELHKFLFK